MDIVFEAIAEDRPGPKWRSVYDRHWHAYSRWFLRDGIRSRPTYLASLKSLKAHMPELLPAYEAIVEMAGGGDLEARFFLYVVSSDLCRRLFASDCCGAYASTHPEL